MENERRSVEAGLTDPYTASEAVSSRSSDLQSGLTAPGDVPPMLLGMMAQAAMSGSAPRGGVVRLRLIDRTPAGDREIVYKVATDEARAYLRRLGWHER